MLLNSLSRSISLSKRVSGQAFFPAQWQLASQPGPGHLAADHNYRNVDIFD
jgi:hypothetical protein